MRLKKKFLSFFLIIFSSIFALLLLEISLRIFYPQQETMRWFESSTEYGYLNKKDFTQDYSYIGHDFIMHVQTNSIGHRYKEYISADFNDKEYKKVLLLGDSFMFGYGVNMEDHIATHIDNQLNDKHDFYTIINAGVGGWGTIQEVTYAKDNFRVFNPDFIILLFCGNDPDDDNRFLANMSDNQKGVIYFPGKIFMRDHSHLYRFIYTRFHILLHNRLIKSKSKDDENLIVNTQSGNIITSEQWERTLKVINEFHAKFIEFNRQGVVLILATAPWLNEHRQKLRSLPNGINLFYVDLYDETIDLPKEKRRLKHDGHWSELIHYIGAKKISNKILELGD